MSKISCGGFKIDDETLKFNENDELTVVGGSGGSEGDGGDSVVWFSYRGDKVGSASSTYNSGDWKVGREWEYGSSNPTPEDILNAFENNKTIKANVQFRECGGTSRYESIMTSLEINASGTYADAYFLGLHNAVMTCIPYTKQ